MIHVTGTLTYTLDTDEEFTTALAGLEVNEALTVTASDIDTRTITVSVDVTS